MNLREIYQAETLDRLQATSRRHGYARVLANERGRRTLGRSLARLAGHALLAVGVRLLTYSGERARLTPTDLAPYSTPSTYSPN